MVFGPLLILGAAALSPASADLPGVWQGSVGNLPVRVCFMDRDWGPFGAYYYLSRQRLIPLEAEEDSVTLFREGGADPNAPRWRIERVAADRLAARWTGRGRSLPVRLTRVTRMEGDESPCGSIAFHQPRLASVRTREVRATTDGVAYRRIALDVADRFDVSLETFAMEGAGEAVRRINAELVEGLAGNPPQWLECIRNSLGSGPNEGGFTENLVPAMITSRWLSVAHHWDGYCGGAHPDSSNTYRTFDRASGQEVDLFTWFNQRAVTRERLEEVDAVITTVRPALRDVVLAGWTPEDPECGELIRSHEFWSIGLTRRGMALSPDLAHVAQACGEELIVPYGRIRPLLTPEGAANLRALETELAVRPAR